MGISSDGILVFGIDLGDKYPDKFIVDENTDFEEFLCKEANLEEWRADFSDEERSAYYEKIFKIKDECPVEIVWYCSYDYIMYILAVKSTEILACRGKAIDVSDKMSIEQSRIDAAVKWCKEHGLDYSAKDFKWLLTSMYG